VKIRQLVFPGTEWYARRPVRSSVNLTRPGLAATISPVVLLLFAVLFVAIADNRWTRAAWIAIGVGALVLATVRIAQRRRRGEEIVYADDQRFVWARTATGRLPSTPAFPGAGDPSDDERIRLVVRWDDVLATSATPTGAPWWAWRRPRLYIDLFVLPAVVTGDADSSLVDVDPPAADLPPTRLRFAVPRFNQRAALNLLRWYSPHLLVDPVTGGSALFLEPDGNPWPDPSSDSPGARQVPIPPGPILGLPPSAVPITEWAPPEPMVTDAGRPDFASADGTAGAATDGAGRAGTVPLRARPPHVAVFGHLGRITGAGRAWRIGWLVMRLLTSVAFLILFVALGIVALTTDDIPRRLLAVSVAFALWFALGVWRYAWRLFRLRDASASFVAFTPGGVRVVDAASYASIPWRAIRRATLHAEGRRRWLCLGIDATVPADVSWAVLRAPTGAQILPGQTVLWLRLPKDEADPRRLGPGLWTGGNVPFDAGTWPR